MHFYPLWVKCLYFLYREFGRRSLPTIGVFMHEIADLYLEAAKVYRVCQSTTKRPKYLGSAHFRIIHLTDPHLHCVPSLHVLVVVLNSIRFCQFVDRLSHNGAAYAKQKRYVYTQAVEITNSILYVKQHSVNCIPAALYALSKYAGEFTENDARAFIDDLLRNDRLETREEIVRFIHTRYQSFMESELNGSYRNVLIDYLRSFEPAR